MYENWESHSFIFLPRDLADQGQVILESLYERVV